MKPSLNKNIHYLNFDSDFFNLNVGKFDALKSFTKKDLKSFFSDLDFDLIYLFIDLEKHKNFNFFEIKIPKFDIYYIDTQFELYMKLAENFNYCQYKIFTNDDLSKIDLEQILDISEEIALYSRFIYDKNFNKEQIFNLYHTTIKNTLNKSYGEGIILNKEPHTGKINGILAIGKDFNSDNILYGREIMIGVKNSYQGHGIGKKMFNCFLSYCKDNNIGKIFTKVSAKNINSLNFHINIGFKIKKISHVFHLWRKN